MTLLKIIESIPWDERQTISGVTISDGRESSKGWTATVSYLAHVKTEKGNKPGVSLQQGDRVPDTLHPISVNQNDPAGDIEGQIRDLDESDLLGNLDSAMLEAETRGHHQWIITSHAGSQEERIQWMRDIGAMR